MEGLSVAATAREVRPWNDFLNAIIFFLPVWKEANLSAFSLASAPELQRKSEKSFLPETSPSFSAKTFCRGILMELE